MDRPFTPRNPRDIIYASDDYETFFKANVEWESLLLLAFPTEDKIFVKKKLSGYSGAYTWLVETTNVDVSSDPSGFYVIKIGHYQSISDEKDKHEHVASGNRLYGNLVKPEGGMYQLSGGFWGLLKFSYAGNNDLNDHNFARNDNLDSAKNSTVTTSLLDHLQHNGPYFEKIMGQIFKFSEDQWKNVPRPEVTYRTYYDRLLPEHLRFEGIDATNITGAYPIKSDRLQDDWQTIFKDIKARSARYVYLQELPIGEIKAGERRELTFTSASPPHVGTFKVRFKYILKETQVVPNNRQQLVSLYAEFPKNRDDLFKEFVRETLKRQDIKKPTFNYEGQTYPNPIAYLEKLLAWRDTLYRSTIHGDLNLQNILVSVQEKPGGAQLQHWVIDLASAHIGPVLLDFQWLEVQVILWLLAKEIQETKTPLTKLKDIFSALEKDQECPLVLDAKLKASYSVLQCIRRFVKKCLHKDDGWDKYYRGLIIALVGATRIRTKELPSNSTSVAFMSAATLLCWSKVLADQAFNVIAEELYPDWLEYKLKPLPPKDPVLIPLSPPAPISEPPSGVETRQKNSFSRRQLLLLTTGVIVSGFSWLYWNKLSSFGVDRWYTFKEMLGMMSPARKIRVGLAIASKGDGNLIGDAQQMGYNIAMEFFKWRLREVGLEIVTLPYDAGSGPLNALQAFKELIDKKVVVIIGPTYSAQADVLFHEQKIKDLFNDDNIKKLFGGKEQEVDLFVERLKKVPVIGPSNTADDIPTYSDYNLRVSAGVEAYAGYAVTSMVTKDSDIKHVALIWRNDKFTTDEAVAFRQAIKDTTIQPGIVEGMDRPYNTENPNYDDVVKDITSETIDLVIVSGRPQDGLEILKRLSDKGYKNKVIGGNGLNVPGIFDSCPELCQGMYIAQAYNYDLPSDINKAFKRAYDVYKESHPETTKLPFPSQLTAQMFTAFQIFVEAIKNVDQRSIDSGIDDFNNGKAPQTLRDALLKQILGHTFETPLGEISFDQTGEITQRSFCVAELDTTQNQFKRIPGSGTYCEEPSEQSLFQWVRKYWSD